MIRAKRKEGTSDNDSIIFRDKGKNVQDSNGSWKILVVDDEESVHSVTKLVLKRFTFDNKSVEIISAFSALEAKKLIDEHNDLAIVLLDVVMEEDSAGFDVVRYIRDTKDNTITRIILRTGQPGHAPEKKIFVDYDINDYKLKTELTEDKLYVTILAALRSYKQLILFDNNRMRLEKIISLSSSFHNIKYFDEFTTSILKQLSSILNVSNNLTTNKSSGIIAIKTDDKFIIADAIGDYYNCIDKNIVEVLSSEELNCLDFAIKENKTMYLSNSIISHFTRQYDSEYIVFIKYGTELNSWDKNLLDVFCTNISITLDNILLNNEIEMSQKEIIFTLGEIAEARSKETGHHVKRVAEYTKLLSLKYGLSNELAEKLRMASPMHDIGKLAIPDKILNKPGKLTPEEFEIMKTHSLHGYEMLKNSTRDIIKIGAIIALQHHEKYNGAGYPAGLKGENIHIYGRISAITDVFDALGSDRVYKKAWDLDKIIALFKDERGQHFDPVLVDLFLNNLDEFLNIRNMFPDKIIDKGTSENNL